MCIISINEKRNLTEEEFENCWESNSHGAGFAWKNKFHKGFMTKEEAYKFYTENVAGNFPHVAHFRIQTSGGTRPELTHPFVIAPMSPTRISGTTGHKGVLFHNGIISGWNTMLLNYAVAINDYPTGHLSDTRVLAMCIDRGSKYIISCLTGSDKFVIFKNNVYQKWGTWEEKDGVFFSNSGYKYGYYKYKGTNNCSTGYSNNMFDYDEWYGKGKTTTVEVVCENRECRHNNMSKALGCNVYYTEKGIKSCGDYKKFQEKNNLMDCQFKTCEFYDDRSSNNCANPVVCIGYDLYSMDTKLIDKKIPDKTDKKVSQYAVKCEIESCPNYQKNFSNNCKTLLNVTKCRRVKAERGTV
jgi:hypothetical protein